jgi:hypothetical protein
MKLRYWLEQWFPRWFPSRKKDLVYGESEPGVLIRARTGDREGEPSAECCQTESEAGVEIGPSTRPDV